MSATRIDIASSLIERGRRILDVGCGDGHFLERVRARFEVCHGVELDRLRAAAARGRGALVSLADLDGAGLPFRDGAFDVVTMLDVLEHVRDPRPALAEIHRVLEPDGVIVVSTPNIRYWKHVFSIAFRGRFPSTSDDPGGYDGGHFHYFTFADVEALMRAAGFVSPRREPVLDPAKYRRASRLLGGHVLREFLSSGPVLMMRKPSA